MTIASDWSCVGRRAVLTGIGAVGLTGVLAACGTDDKSSPPSAGAAGTGSTPPAAAATTESSAGTSGALTATADVPVGGGVVVNGVLIVQPESGTFKAYNAACPHQGVQLGAPQNDVITCPAHHSKFKADDGSRISGPATRGLTEIAVTVQGADIVRA
jgi:nitrite reductase/ring-hydroxylating ferredoxin subunit